MHEYLLDHLKTSGQFEELGICESAITSPCVIFTRSDMDKRLYSVWKAIVLIAKHGSNPWPLMSEISSVCLSAGKTAL